MWLAKLLFALVGMVVLSAGSLLFSWHDATSTSIWVAGVVVGGTAMTAYLVAWSTNWLGDYRRRAENEAERGRAYYPAWGAVVSVVLLITLEVGGAVAVFTWSAIGSFLGVFTLWFIAYVPRNWRKVRRRLERSRAI
jgi:hypothetical protein